LFFGKLPDVCICLQMCLDCDCRLLSQIKRLTINQAFGLNGKRIIFSQGYYVAYCETRSLVALSKGVTYW
jgi:hypothetical protein